MVTLPESLYKTSGPQLVHNGNTSNSYGLAALDDECRKVANAAKGQRNDTLNKAAFALSQLVAGGELNENDVRTRLHGAATACGLDSQEIVNTLASGFTGGERAPRAAPENRTSYVQQSVTDKALVLPEINAASFAGKPVPTRKFHDAQGMIPSTGVTLLYGDGGTGKSLLALQLASSTVAHKNWLGINVRQGPVYYYSCEDTVDEMHIRLSAIEAFQGSSLGDLTGLHIAPMVGHDCVFGAPDKSGIIRATPILAAFIDRAKMLRPAIIIVDNAIDVFAGDQNNGAQVKQFMHLLSAVSIECDCPILLLAHPSKSSMANGTGDSGSVHWSNSARARLYLTRITTADEDGKPIEDDPCARVLRVMKANYAATGDEIKMRWEDGCFVHEAVERPSEGDGIGAASKAERVFLHLLRWHIDRNVHVSPSRSSTYAPTVFAKHPQREGVSKWRFEQAMTALLDQRKIEVQEHGPASKRRKNIAIVEGER